MAESCFRVPEFAFLCELQTPPYRQYRLWELARVSQVTVFPETWMASVGPGPGPTPSHPWLLWAAVERTSRQERMLSLCAHILSVPLKKSERKQTKLRK